VRQAGTATRSFDPALIRLALSFARRCGARAEDAEDLAQEALLKLVTHADTVENPAAWLRIVVRRLSAHGRTREEPLPTTPQALDPWVAVDLDIDTRRVLERMGARERASVLLSLAGYSERESSVRLGCSLKATEKALHQARRQVRRFLRA
jgi:RNA polymerase sigma factor (sigma-70 family)